MGFQNDFDEQENVNRNRGRLLDKGYNKLKV